MSAEHQLGVFSEYDDLGTLKQVESQSTVGSYKSAGGEASGDFGQGDQAEAEGPKSFLEKLTGGHSQPPSPAPDRIRTCSRGSRLYVDEFPSEEGRHLEAIEFRDESPNSIPQLLQALNIDTRSSLVLRTGSHGHRHPKRG